MLYLAVHSISELCSSVWRTHTPPLLSVMANFMNSNGMLTLRLPDRLRASYDMQFRKGRSQETDNWNGSIRFFFFLSI